MTTGGQAYLKAIQEAEDVAHRMEADAKAFNYLLDVWITWNGFSTEFSVAIAAMVRARLERDQRDSNSGTS